MTRSPKVELTIPIIPDMELAASQTAEVVAKHMNLDEEKRGEISMALIEACINAFEHSKTEEKEIEIRFIIEIRHRREWKRVRQFKNVGSPIPPSISYSTILLR